MTSRVFITSDGVKLALHEHGDGEAPFFFQHGLCGAVAQPAEVTPELNHLRLLTLECRGHGRSEAGDFTKFSIKQFADDVAEVISELGRPVILGGISMGAAISLRLAIKRPELIRALVLARPAWVTDYAPDNMKPNAFVGELLSKMNSKEAEQHFLNSAIAQRLEAEAPDNLHSLKGFFHRAPQHVTAALLSCISVDGPGVDRTQVEKITFPTLMIGHEDDFIHPLSYAKDLAKLIPHSEFVLITSKVRDKMRYVSDFQNALSQFLKKVSHAEASY